MASRAPPNTAATATTSGACATATLAPGQAASHCRKAISGTSAQAAACQSGAHSAPSTASGVTTTVTHGIASRLASSPTTEACPNSSSVSGVSARVTTHCSRSKAFNRPLTPVAPAPAAPESVAKSTPTATKLSQKPACSQAHGSNASTSAQASSHVSHHGQRTPTSRSAASVASISTVRCAGTPQPLNSA